MEVEVENVGLEVVAGDPPQVREEGVGEERRNSVLWISSSHPIFCVIVSSASMYLLSSEWELGSNEPRYFLIETNLQLRSNMIQRIENTVQHH